MPEFVDGLANVVEREVPGGLVHAGEHAGGPATRQFLQRADVEIAVMEEFLQGRHLAREEAPILADAVATHR